MQWNMELGRMVSSVLWFGTCHTRDPVITRVSTACMIRGTQQPEQQPFFDYMDRHRNYNRVILDKVEALGTAGDFRVNEPYQIQESSATVSKANRENPLIKGN